jgi:hypothetical protein
VTIARERSHGAAREGTFAPTLREKAWRRAALTIEGWSYAPDAL